MQHIPVWASCFGRGVLYHPPDIEKFKNISLLLPREIGKLNSRLVNLASYILGPFVFTEIYRKSFCFHGNPARFFKSEMPLNCWKQNWSKGNVQRRRQTAKHCWPNIWNLLNTQCLTVWPRCKTLCIRQNRLAMV